MEGQCPSCTMNQQLYTIQFTTIPKEQYQQGYLLIRVQLFIQFFEQIFCYTSMSLFSSHFFVTDNLLDKLSKKKLRVETMEKLFTKIRNKFEKTTKEKQKIEQLRTIKQKKRTYNKYIQKFKKVV